MTPDQMRTLVKGRADVDEYRTLRAKCLYMPGSALDVYNGQRVRVVGHYATDGLIAVKPHGYPNAPVIVVEIGRAHV